MAGNKYLYNNGGSITEKVATQTTAANEIVALDNTGKLNVNMMPTGIGPEVESIVASETLAAGDFVNKFSAANICQARKADASSASKEADGFVLAGCSAANMAQVYALGGEINNQVSGLTPGAMQFLSDVTPGKTIEIMPPTTSGGIVQKLGRASTATTLLAIYSDPIVLA